MEFVAWTFINGSKTNFEISALTLYLGFFLSKHQYLSFFHKLIFFVGPCPIGDSVTTLTLGSRPRQRLAKVQAKSEAQESHFMLLEV
jgi:hypothetical protein